MSLRLPKKSFSRLVRLFRKAASSELVALFRLVLARLLRRKFDGPRYLRAERVVIGAMYGFAVLYATLALFLFCDLIVGEVQDFILYNELNWERVARLVRDLLVFSVMGAAVWVYVRYLWLLRRRDSLSG